MSDVESMVYIAAPVLLIIIIISLMTNPSDNYQPKNRDEHDGESSYYPRVYPMRNSGYPSQNVHPTYPYPTHHRHPQHPYDPNRHHHDRHHYHPHDNNHHHHGRPAQPNLGPGGTQHLLGPGGTQQQQ